MKIKKTILLMTAALCMTAVVKAQEFEVGTNAINVGIGFGGYYYGNDLSGQSPVFSASYERGVWDVPGPGVVSSVAIWVTKDLTTIDLVLTIIGHILPLASGELTTIRDSISIT